MTGRTEQVSRDETPSRDEPVDRDASFARGDREDPQEDTPSRFSTAVQYVRSGIAFVLAASLPVAGAFLGLLWYLRFGGFASLVVTGALLGVVGGILDEGWDTAFGWGSIVGGAIASLLVGLLTAGQVAPMVYPVSIGVGIVLFTVSFAQAERRYESFFETSGG